MKLILLIKNKYFVYYKRITAFLKKEKVLPFCSGFILITLLILLLNLSTLTEKWAVHLWENTASPQSPTLSQLLEISCEQSLPTNPGNPKK